MRKAKLMKKILAGVLAVSTILSVGITAACDDSDELSAEEKEAQTHTEFIDEIGGVSETYTGTISQNNYLSADEAATSFVEAEVVGEKEVDVLDTTKTSDLTPEEITALNIDTTGVLAVEEYEVTYADAQDYTPASTQDTPSSKVRVYIIKYANHWEYYTPCPVTGETITKSYYDSIFDMESYKNCSYLTESKMKMAVTATEDGISVRITDIASLSQLIKYEEGKIYIEQTVVNTAKMEVVGYPDFTETETTTSNIYAYLENVGTELVCYAKVVQNGQVTQNWTADEISTIGFESTEELVPFADGYLDYTYFTKTDYGFALDGEQAERFLEETVAQLDEYESIIKDMDIRTIVKYYVQNGILSGMRQDLTIGFDQTIEGIPTKINLNMVITCKAQDYGTTVVTKPTGIN
ncbi:MAG: hypothetical protein IJY11_01500 [Clostridia bacterium]|nr:hypothetical protein [Clostridia bacterium]